MTVETCLDWSKHFGEAGNSQLSLFYLERARQKVLKHSKYKGMKGEGFKLVPMEQPKPQAKPKKKETKKDGKKSKR